VRYAYRILVEKPEGKIPLWRPWHGLEENIKIDLEENGFEDVRIRPSCELLRHKGGNCLTC
jgi:hypothetical protein